VTLHNARNGELSVTCCRRHCPECRTNTRDQWLRKHQHELLPVGYFHLAFNVPHVLVPLMWQNKRRGVIGISSAIAMTTGVLVALPLIAAAPACYLLSVKSTLVSPAAVTGFD
jgi:hypothetical protein